MAGAASGVDVTMLSGVLLLHAAKTIKTVRGINIFFISVQLLVCKCTVWKAEIIQRILKNTWSAILGNVPG